MNKRELVNELSRFDNVADMLRYLMDTYDLDNCKPSWVTKALLTGNLASGVLALNPEKKSVIYGKRN